MPNFFPTLMGDHNPSKRHSLLVSPNCSLRLGGVRDPKFKTPWRCEALVTLKKAPEFCRKPPSDSKLFLDFVVILHLQGSLILGLIFGKAAKQWYWSNIEILSGECTPSPSRHPSGGQKVQMVLPSTPLQIVPHQIGCLAWRKSNTPAINLAFSMPAENNFDLRKNTAFWQLFTWDQHLVYFLSFLHISANKFIHIFWKQ